MCGVMEIAEPSFSTVIVPIVTREDAVSTASTLRSHIDGSSTVIAIQVIEKAGGAPDEAAVEQREQRAAEIVAIERDPDERPITPRGDTLIKANDLLTVYSATGADPELTDIFGHYEARAA